jgi:hypothetical protein
VELQQCILTVRRLSSPRLLTCSLIAAVFASKLILFPISALMMGNIVLLIVGPVIVVLVEMGAWGVQWARVRGRARVTGNGNIVTGGRGLRGASQSSRRLLLLYCF